MFISHDWVIVFDRQQDSEMWQIWIDRGGTFTDLVARRPDGSVTTCKLLSSNPEHYQDAAIQGIRDLLGLGKNDIIPPRAISVIKMGTTIATNALLEREGERTVFVTTKGFGDALRIGYQNRPDIFARHIVLPELLYERTVEIPERVDAHGSVLTPLDEKYATEALSRALGDGFKSVAIAFVHGYRHSQHEVRVARLARKLGFDQVSASHEVSPLMRLISRGDTTVVDAYLSPLLRRYVEQIVGELEPEDRSGPQLLFMQSNGGLTSAHLFRGKDSILSGPAGGVVGMVRTAEAAGFDKVIGFDMGGTSTDVSQYNGEYERTFDSMVAGVRVRAPMMNIHTVAAGGGSILKFDGARFRVGPDSAGANPGPACYRRNGPLTVTDCNVMLGKLQPDFFPPVLGPDANQSLDSVIVKSRFEQLAKRIAAETGNSLQAPEVVAGGFLRVAVENMANAIKKISIQRGYDVTEYILNCFGGAGGQHACLVAESLGVNNVLLHPFAGVLSAYGMGLAYLRSLRERQIEQNLSRDSISALEDTCRLLAVETSDEILSQGVPRHRITLLNRAHLRYEGTDTALIVPVADEAAMQESFEKRHRSRFGFIVPGRQLIIEAASVEAVGETEELTDSLTASPSPDRPASPLNEVQFYSGEAWHTAPIFKREDLQEGQSLSGPAIIIEATATTVVEPDWSAETRKQGQLVLQRSQTSRSNAKAGTGADPVLLEVFNNLFMSIAEQMGATLANTAYSVNIKERLDFSCAIFAPNGSLVANAPHVPVHLGSMGESIKTVISARGDRMRPGDVYALNAPYNGGTHLPDVTVVTPVFDSTEAILFYVAARGHHADIGGRTPGSAPPDSTSIHQEGVLIDNFLLVEQGTLREAETRQLLSTGTYPCRNVEQNMADLRAQIAANETGVFELKKIIDHFGLNTVHAYMQHVQDNAEESVRRVLDVLQDGTFTYHMDNGCRICVAIRVDRASRSASIDFSGTSDQHKGNYNAPSAVCKAAVLYVFRTLVDDNIPLNEGCLKPLHIHIPPRSIISPEYPAAVIAGNTEVSQGVTDALYGALGVLASSQGTVNNFVYGTDKYQNYETICGGTGAGPNHPGCDAVHSHMTNTRMTDPEVLEWRFPVRVESFAIRHGSGGAGKYPGGAGVIRRLKFLESMTVTTLSSHRIVEPYGLAGGCSGKQGYDAVERASGGTDHLRGNDETIMLPGDVFVMETPGGGGFGPPPPGDDL